MVALIGLVFQLGLTAVLAIMQISSFSQALMGLLVFTGTGNLIWLYLVLIYHQRVLVSEERLESEQLKRERERGISGEAIFDVEAEQLLLARRRLEWMHKWMLPAFTVAIVVLLVAGAFVPWRWSLATSLHAPGWPSIRNVSVMTFFTGGLALLTFLFSRYASGMSRLTEWRMLRAGASYLMGIVLLTVALCGTLAAIHFMESPIAERVLAFAIRYIMLILAAEITLNFVLDFYRPRAADEEPRPAFDSRLLGLFSEPGGIARSIAEAINYQFGFEVSGTWFYKLLERSVVPLIGFGVVVMFAATCFVFVNSDEEVVVERFGQKRAVLEPGLHYKWPWPLEIAYPVQTQRIHVLDVGPKVTPDEQDKTSGSYRLWTNKHEVEPHLNVLVATPQLAEFITQAQEETFENEQPEAELAGGEVLFTASGEAVAVSQLRISVTIQYRIQDAYQWLRTYKDPEAMLEAVAEREIMRRCASEDVMKLLGAERSQIEQDLWNAIADQARNMNLGVNIVFLGLQGVHPPTDTAGAFQEVIGAEQKRSEAIRNARRISAQRLTKIAGDASQARQLARMIDQLHTAEADPQTDPAELKALREQTDRLLFGQDGQGGIGGEAAAALAKARSRRWQLENSAHGWAMQFKEEVRTKNAAPEVYALRKYLEVLARHTSDIRKYVSALQGQVETYNLNIQDSMNTPLDVLIESSNLGQ